MEELTTRKQSVLDVLDTQINELEGKLAKYRPYFDELESLKQTRRVLLGASKLTGGAGRTNHRLSMEEVVTALRGQEMQVKELAQILGHEENTVRSHLNRGVGTRYVKREGSGNWALLEEVADE